jgi:hypothetical protein
MTDDQRFDALNQLIRLMNLDLKPTIRETGLSETVLKTLRDEGMIELYDDVSKRDADPFDRYGVAEITSSSLSDLGTAGA